MSSTVTTKYGKVEGVESDGMRTWFGIPFAKPPVGDLRFRRPQEPDAWEGVLDVKAMSPRPIQFTDITAALEQRPPLYVDESEDCLYLNIWAPENADNCPVFVWIYGGANAYGYASDPSYGGESFAREGVIFVNFNYRVGPLGFYDFSDYSDEFDSNCGVADQIAAVRWVKENIAAFGGDPDNITIAGESAGAEAVLDLLVSPQAKGLFSKAIVQSGLTGAAAESRRIVKLNMDLYLEKLGIDPADVARIKTMSVGELRPAAEWLMVGNAMAYPGIYVPGPVIDDIVPSTIADALEQGSAEGVDIIIGTNKDEGQLFTMLMPMFPSSWEQVARMLELNDCPEKLADLKAIYNIEPEIVACAELVNDMVFWSGAVASADAQSNHGNVYAYRCDFTPDGPAGGGLGSLHASEIGFALDTPSVLAPMLVDTAQSRIDEITKVMHGSWVAFAKTGDPNGAHLPLTWERYDQAERKTILFNDECALESNPKGERYELWKNMKLYQ